MVVLIIDHAMNCLGRTSAPVSPLMLPLGVRSFLDHITLDFAEDLDHELLIMPTFQYGPDYEHALRASSSTGVRVTSPHALHEELDECEASDFLVAIDTVQWPINALNLRLTMPQHHEYCAVSYLVAIGAEPDKVRERVEWDGQGGVKRIQRLYTKTNWPEVTTTKTIAAMLPARLIDGGLFTSLSELRVLLSRKGVLSRDIPLAVDLVPLTQEDGLLALNERMLLEGMHARAMNGFIRRRENVVVSRQSTIHPSVRLVGPIIIHDHAIIEPDVQIVGPVVIGRGCRIRRGATIVQSLLAPGATVPVGATILQRIAAGQCTSSTVNGKVDAHPTPFPWRSSLTQPKKNGRPLLPPHSSARRRRVQSMLKRLMDMTLSSVALVLLLPFLIIIAIMIKLDSRGPVLFIHHREGEGGKDFPCLKFRTMVDCAHRQQRALYKRNEVDGPQFQIREDPRLTRLGPWLRRTNIDELPQLINVLLGHMSLVGARPSPFRENQICIPWRRARLSVKPGITGLWQLCRKHREGGDFHQWIYYDMLYVRNLSVWLDIKILLGTIVALVGGWSVPLSWCLPAENAPSATHKEIGECDVTPGLST